MLPNPSPADKSRNPPFLFQNMLCDKRPSFKARTWMDTLGSSLEANLVQRWLHVVCIFRWRCTVLRVTQKWPDDLASLSHRLSFLRCHRLWFRRAASVRPIFSSHDIRLLGPQWGALTEGCDDGRYFWNMKIRNSDTEEKKNLEGVSSNCEESKGQYGDGRSSGRYFWNRTV